MSAFDARVATALADETLRGALSRSRETFVGARARAVALLPEFDAIRDQGAAIKDHVLANLDLYLERYEAVATAAGATVHWASDTGEACETVLEICRAAGAKTVNKGKSMISEEMGLNGFLEARGIEPVETDLGEYIIQLRGEAPSHIIAPALHLTKGQVAETFREHHDQLDPGRPLDDPRDLLAEARSIMRAQYFRAEVGITGANFLIAETGSSIIVTNEGNGDLSQLLPRVHIVLASIEKIVPTLEDATVLLRLLARSATGQEMSTYTTVSTGPRRADDPDGPEEYHVVLLDNGRSAMLGTEFQEMLRCIKCGACMNHCPVYRAIGGHAYGWVYGGPMGSVLTPLLRGADGDLTLATASSFCGACEAVCPVKIPLPGLLRRLRERRFEGGGESARARWALGLWAFVATRPWIYRTKANWLARVLALAGRRRGRFRRLPFAGGWTRTRDFPAPQGASFIAQWQASQKGQPPRGQPPRRRTQKEQPQK